MPRLLFPCSFLLKKPDIPHVSFGFLVNNMDVYNVLLFFWDKSLLSSCAFTSL